MENKEKTFLVSKNDILSGVAKWAVAQSPYHRPDNLEIVLDKLNINLISYFKDEIYLELSYREINNFIKLYTFSIEEFMQWNERKNGREGHLGFSSRYDRPMPDDDFIDLDALIRNIANDIIRDKYQKSIPEILGEGILVKESDIKKWWSNFVSIFWKRKVCSIGIEG